MLPQEFDYEAALRSCSIDNKQALQNIYMQESNRLLGVVLRIVRQRQLPKMWCTTPSSISGPMQAVLTPRAAPAAAGMFNQQVGIYMHGWVEGMSERPEFQWARANGWAMMAMVELLDVLPPGHPGYPKVLAQLRAHVKGLAAYQDGTGFWYQLIERNDTYLETSATAMYAYSMTRAINRGWIDKTAYAPMVLLAWNAVATKVNDKGLVEGTCVGTGMGFDPAFYMYRQVNSAAAHGYGPVLLAGAKIITLIKSNTFWINDSATMLKVQGAKGLH